MLYEVITVGIRFAALLDGRQLGHAIADGAALPRIGGLDAAVLLLEQLGAGQAS